MCICQMKRSLHVTSSSLVKATSLQSWEGQGSDIQKSSMQFRWDSLRMAFKCPKFGLVVVLQFRTFQGYTVTRVKFINEVELILHPHMWHYSASRACHSQLPLAYHYPLYFSLLTVAILP